MSSALRRRLIQVPNEVSTWFDSNINFLITPIGLYDFLSSEMYGIVTPIPWKKDYSIG
jgi:hypothetical protein